jgi:hypothetical protein
MQLLAAMQLSILQQTQSSKTLQLLAGFSYLWLHCG